jgi:PAS domain-containing protein
MRVAFHNQLPVRLAGIILVMGFVAVPIISELKRRAVERIVLQQAEVQAATATIAVVEGLQDVLSSVETTVRTLARDLEDRDLSREAVDRIIRNTIAGNPNLSDCSISFEPYSLSPAMERFGRYANRSDTQPATRDLAAPEYRYWTQQWYGDAIGKGELAWSEPFFDKGGANTTVVRASAPFFRTIGGRRVLAGVIAAGFDLAWVKQLTGENEFFDSGYVIIFSHAGRLIAHPNQAYVFTETMESLAQKANDPELARIHQRVLARRQGSVSYMSNVFHQRVHENYKPAQFGGWGVVVGYEEAEFLRQIGALRWITMLSLAGTLALLSAIVLLATQIALRPLKRLTAVSDEISRGNLDCEIRPPARDDEVGRLNRSFLVMRDVLKKNRLLERRVQEDAADLASANERLSIENLERCWINQALEHQLRYDRLIVNSITDLVFVLTKTMNISRMNPAVVHLSGWEPHELVNSPLARVVRLDGGGHGSVASPADPLAQALGEGRDLRDQPAILEDRKGHSIPVRLTLFPLRDGNKVVGGVAVVTPAAVIRPSIQNTP